MSLGEWVTSAPIRTFSQRVDVPWDNGPAGKAKVSAIQISRDSDLSSPPLALLAANGTVTSTAQVVLASGAFTIGLDNVKVTDVSTDSTQDGVPIEKLTLLFQKVTWTYSSGSSSTTVTYDPMADTTGGPLTPNFVFFGQGVDPSYYAGQTPFTKLVFGLTGPNPEVGKTVVSPLTLATGITEETVKQFGTAIAIKGTNTVTARFTALGTTGPVDRVRYVVKNVVVKSMAIDTAPAGVLQETLALQVGGKITWTAQPLTGGDDVTAEWDPTGPAH